MHTIMHRCIFDKDLLLGPQDLSRQLRVYKSHKSTNEDGVPIKILCCEDPKTDKCKQKDKKRVCPPPCKPRVAFWRMMSLCVAMPALALVALVVFSNKMMEEERPRPPFIHYGYLAIRHKKFPWGDGTRGLFHNPKKNWTQYGYDDEREAAEAAQAQAESSGNGSNGNGNGSNGNGN